LFFLVFKKFYLTSSIGIENYLQGKLMVFIVMYQISYLFSYKRIFIPFIVLFLSFIGGMNSNIEDFYSYYDIYTEVPDFMNLIDDFSILHDIYGEDGYLVYNSIMKLIFDNYYLLRVLLLVISLSIIFYVFSKTTYLLPITILYYLASSFYLHTIILRTTIATALIFLSFYLFENRRYIYSFLLYLLALSFHLVAIFAILVYIIHKYIPFRKSFFIVVLLLSLMISQIGLVNILVFVFDNLFSHSFISLKLNAMQNGSIVYTGGIIRGTVLLHLIILTLFFILFSKLKNFKYFNIFFISYFMSIVYLIIFNDISIVGDRLFSVYSISLGVLLSYMFYCAKINNIKIFVTIFTVLIFLLLFFKSLYFLPYEFMSGSL